MPEQTCIKMSLRFFNASLLDGLEKRVALFSQYIKRKYNNIPVLSNQEWMEEFKSFTKDTEEPSLEDIIKAFLANEETKD